MTGSFWEITAGRVEFGESAARGKPPLTLGMSSTLFSWRHRIHRINRPGSRPFNKGCRPCRDFPTHVFASGIGSPVMWSNKCRAWVVAYRRKRATYATYRCRSRTSMTIAGSSAPG